MKKTVRWALAAGVAALVAGSLAGRLTAQSPRPVALRPAIRQRPLGIDRGAAAVWQSLLKLRTRASLIMITAHPDDEDGGLLAYESRGEGARVALLTLNRGESGQNLMTGDYFDAMGLLRAEELLAADQYYGVQQYFSRVIDFGFSKSKEETIDKWTHDRTLYDVVRTVRMVRPLVISSVFVGTYSDGHGHHQYAGQMAQEAFKAAADPSVFPDQIRAGLRPWAALKMYARVPTFAVRDNEIYDYADGHTYPLRFFNYIDGTAIEGQLSTNVVVPEGTYDPLLGGSYAQVARQGLGFQKSQNGGTGFLPPGPADSAYHRFASRVPATDREQTMFDGIDVSLAGIADLAAKQDNGFLKSALGGIDTLVAQAISQFDARNPERIAPLLAQGEKATTALIAQVQSSSLTEDAKYNVLHELRIKQAQFNNALAETLGLSVLASVVPAREPSGPFARFLGPAATFRVAIPGQAFFVSVRVANQGSAPLKVARLWIDTPQGESWSAAAEGSAPASLDPGQDAAQRFRVQAPDNAAYTRPYYSRVGVKQPYYNIDDPRYLNLPFAPYPVSGWAEIDYQGVPVRVGQVAQTIQREVGPGQVAEPLVVGPAISLWISPHAGVAPLGAKPFPVSVLVHSNVKGPAKGTVRLELPPGWQSTPAAADFSTSKDGENKPIEFEVQPASVEAKPYELRAVADYNGRQYREGYERVGYQGIRPYYFYQPANYETTGTNVKVAPGLDVGYVVGTGDEVPATLEDLGITVKFLSATDIATGDLSRYGAIVLGERAYSVRPDLAAYNQRLLGYVQQGGVLIVQYQAGEYDHSFGPYPLTLGRAETVTDEDSAVQFLLPDNPAMLWPNKLTQADFQGWVEERGHGYPQSWDPHWQALLEMHDPGQAPQKGGLLIAPYGKGEYVYVALALYRQLPEGVPGAYCIIANLLSLGHNPERQSGMAADR
ncbi:MAG TPA: PIG-L family deacetylase [Candidatus Acidoferrales bacterium]|nr:PIG-L family deacetylase [Candidatus Acidoferrales bacterium]